MLMSETESINEENSVDENEEKLLDWGLFVLSENEHQVRQRKKKKTF